MRQARSQARASLPPVYGRAQNRCANRQPATLKRCDATAGG